MTNLTVLDIYQTYQNANGSSGRGNSWYSVASICGRKAHLEEEDRAERQGQIYTSRDVDDYFAVGTAYHLFHQLAASESLDPDLVLDMTDTRLDGAFLEGLRLFRGWQQLWGSMHAKYGPVLATERSLVADEGTFVAPYTGRMDALVEIEDAEGVRLRTGLQLEPGQYIVDYKTAKGANAADAFRYSMGNQGRGYLHMYPEARGIIFDVLYKVQTFRHDPKIASTGRVVAGKSYAHHIQRPQVEDKDVIGNLVRIGKHNYDLNLANPAACMYGMKPCAFLANGRCGGF